MQEINTDYKELLNEKFTSLHKQSELQYNNLLDKLSSIDEQVKRTNGRVITLENKVSELEKKDLTHSLSCPKTKVFEHLEKSIAELKEDMDRKLQDVNFFVRNPKLGLAIIVTAVLFTIFSYFEIKNYILNQIDKPKTEITK